VGKPAGGALVFETAPLEEDVEILGAPLVELELCADKPVAMAAIRLSDVFPDGRATRVTYGLLNLTHRDGSEAPEPLALGERYRVRVRLNDIAQWFPVGHRMRISISTSYWPLAWPPPEPATLTITSGQSTVTIPERPARDADSALAPFGEPEGAAPLAVERLEPGHHNWLVHRDLAADSSMLEVINDNGTYCLPHADLTLRIKAVERYSSVYDDFDTPRGETHWEWTLFRAGWSIRTVTRTVLTSTPTEFQIVASLDAYEGEKRVWSANWDVAIQRDLV
jgi:hypothetical protein